MDEINLDLDLKPIDDLGIDINLPKDDSSTETKTINVTKKDNSENKGIDLDISNNTSTTSNIGLELLVNKKKTSGDNNNVKSNVVDDVIKNTNTEKTPSLEKSSTESKSNDLDNILNDITLDTTPTETITLNDSSSSNSIPDLKPSDDSFFKNLDNDIFTDTNEKKNDIFNQEQKKPKSFEDIQKDKFELLCKLERLEEKGIKISKKFSMASDYEEMKYEYDRALKDRELSQSVKFQRKMLIAFVTAIEFLNSRFDPFDVKLDGWSESVHENQHDYDDVFEELHEKYKEKAKMAPELKLMMMLGGSAFMFHLTNTMFKSSLPGMGDIMKQNPELMQQFAKAAASSMSQNEESSGFGNFMGDIIGNSDNNNSSSQREMKGPPNIDNILNNMSDNNMNNFNMDSGSEISASDVEEIRNIKLNKNNGKKGITLDIN